METKINRLNELQPNQKNVFVNNVTVVETSEIIEKEIKGEKVMICTGKIIDESITEPLLITAWGHATQFLFGSKAISLENCFAKLYENKEEGISRIEISTGKYGIIVKIR